MATLTIYGGTDGYVKGNNATYATARETGSGFALNTLNVGQNTSGTYECFESFLRFDTSSVVDPTAAVLSLDGASDSSTTDFIAEARSYDWGATLAVADYVAGSALGGLTLLGTWDSAGYSAGYNDFTSEAAFIGNLNLSGETLLVISSDRHRLATVPTTIELVGFASANAAGTTTDPKLVVTTSPASSDDFLEPDSDVAINSWTTDTGATTDLYAAIDELTASDTDYIQSPAGPTTAQYYETALETHADPLSSSGHIVHYRYQKNVAGGNVGLTASLLEGTVSAELLSANAQSIETDATSWGASLDVTRAQSTLQALDGSASLLITSTTNSSTAFKYVFFNETYPAVVPGRTYTFKASFRAVSTSRLNEVGVLWVGPNTTFFGTPVADNSSGWTEVTFTGVAPAGATAAQMKVKLANTTPSGEGHYADRMSMVLEPLIASWSHTNIPNTWTQQNQTLTGAEADSITNYSDLRLRFTPNMVTTDQTTPVPTFVADRASANSNSAVTTVDLVLTSLTVGNYLIVRSAADNSGGGGAARTMTVSNQSGTAMGTHTEYQQNNDPGAASAGVTCNVSVIKIAATSGTIRLTYAGSVVQACVAEEWSGIHATTPVVGTPVGASGVNSTNMASLAEVSVALGNVAYGVEAIEGPSTDVYVQDADTTGGAWVGLTKLGTTNVTADTNMTVYGAYKAPTAAGAQTYNPTITATARDSAGLILELAAAATPAPTIKAQVSWANFELPAVTSTPRSFGAQVGLSLEPLGAVAFGAGDA